MNQLIPTHQTENGELKVHGHELYEFLLIKERYSKWFERMTGYGFTEGVDYSPYQMVHPQNLQMIEDHKMTINMAKEISMLQRTQRGKEARQYFLKLEMLWNSPEMIMKRALEFANAKINELNNTIDIQKPKVLFADSVADSNGCILIGDLAKMLKQNGIDIGATRLFRWMRENGYLIKRKGTDYNMPTQKSMEMGLFRIKETAITHSNGFVTLSKTPKVTGKGQPYFINKFLKNGVPA
ncbi:phage antirepressor KilAC domain-containing protein [Sporolactobacillus terrae]|uniref:phage antirepressor KilAC domain-containing protein n=1 Tax=Sporolactobacillus terrae TaxID=269673 RepID=UPI001CBE3A12|nr:phage antirepressor KilAC domain-containing protein [Sporolactobacillus terrae]UAK17595.1 phage antirepressor KilAC domain-containing protein [Sporolactobacillus terrae]